MSLKTVLVKGTTCSPTFFILFQQTLTHTIAFEQFLNKLTTSNYFDIPFMGKLIASKKLLTAYERIHTSADNHGTFFRYFDVLYDRIG